MTILDFTNKIKSGEAKVLTLSAAKQLIDKPVYLMYFSGNSVMEMIIGKIVLEKEYYKNIDINCANYANRYEYWLKECPIRAKTAERDQMLFDADGKPTYLKCIHNNPYYDLPTFVGSDADREVYYIEK